MWIYDICLNFMDCLDCWFYYTLRKERAAHAKMLLKECQRIRQHISLNPTCIPPELLREIDADIETLKAKSTV